MNVKSTSDVYVGEYPFNDNLKDELVPILENYKDIQDRKSNVKAAMTEWKVTTPQIERLKRYVENEMHKFSPNSMSQDGKEMVLRWKDFWGNGYRKGDYTQIHHHKPSVFSFVYFLKTKWYYSSLMFTDFGEKVRPKEGKFVVFPGHLLHSVPKHRYNETRITLSGNLYYNEVCRESWLSNSDKWEVSLI